MAWAFEAVAGGHKGPIGGIVWDGEGVLFSVPEENVVLRYSPDSTKVDLVRKYTNHVTGLAFATDGRLFACQTGSRRMIEFHDDGSATQLAYRIDGQPHNHPRDVAVDRVGRVWFCDCHSDMLFPGPKLFPPLDHASVLRQDQSPQLQSRAWKIRRMTFDTTVPGALLLSRDEETLYVSENNTGLLGRRELRAYPIVDGDELGTPVVLQTFGADYRGTHRGIEGMCLDSEGNIIACAGWQRSGPGPVVMVIAPTGAVLESWPVPEDMPTRCAFGDDDLSSLYVGTTRGNVYRVSATGRKGYRRT